MGKEAEKSDKPTLARGYSSLSPNEDKDEAGWRRHNDGDDRELSVIEKAAYSEAANEDILLEDLKVYSRLLLLSFSTIILYLCHSLQPP